MSDVTLHHGAEHAAEPHEHGHHHPFLQHHFEDMGQQHEASTLGMWFFIAQEILFFGGAFMAYFIYREMYPEWWGRLSALLVFIGFNLTFFPQFLVGYVGMPRRYHAYAPEFQVLNVLSTAGATVLAVGYLLPMIYLVYSLKFGRKAGNNPWGAAGLEWATTSPPPKENFYETPVVTWDAYDYPAFLKAMRETQDA